MSIADFGLYRQVADLANVVGVGYGKKTIRGKDTNRKAVVVLVKEKIEKKKLERSSYIPKNLAGLPTDVIEVGDIRLLNNRIEIMRPAKPGISIGHYKVSAGTFGAVVYDKKTSEPLILSNNHVLANLTNGDDGRAQTGDAITQPGLYDSENGNLEELTIGYLEKFIPLHLEWIAPQCKIAQFFERIINKIINTVKPQYQIRVLRESEKANLVDCAVAKPIRPELIQPAVLDIGEIKGSQAPSVGMKIKKSGRSSGLTHSMIIATDVTIRININNRETGLFTDQVLAGPMSLPGDSGSLIVTDDNNGDNYGVGLLFAGSEQATLFNKIDHVLQTLNVTLTNKEE
ncbi:hypothetical protein P22_0324 [Propionispora sp. 2/2-37]|uniref:hypothetical protein n=1 Tax=Propionispora sp. 2/2-37 TaxID=1677858 RepID=UPI0006BB561C|nr:hypothetical protein [Propionispora sp. 2/2-37]CUH94258.1 hypothetical protein P22_0324 [Propionispora sp. 2/2-37]